MNGYQELVNTNNNNSLFGKNTNFNPNFPAAPQPSVNNQARNRRIQMAKARNVAAFNAEVNKGDILKKIQNSASQIPGIAFTQRRAKVPSLGIRGGKRGRKTRKNTGGRR